MARKRSYFGFVSIICGLAVALGVLVGGFGITAIESRQNRLALENLYKSGFYDFRTAVDNMEMNLSKLMVSSASNETANLAFDTYLSSQTAVSGLSVLPVENEVYFKTSKLINQVGDMCNCYSMAIGRGEDCSTFENNIERVYDVTNRLKGAVDDIAEGWNNDYRIINGKLDDFAPLNLSSKDTKENTFEYPEIIYDGPFSDVEGEECFEGLEGLKEIDEKDAIDRVNDLFAEYGIHDLKVVGEGTSPASFIIEGTLRRNDVFITISKKGGKVINYDSGASVKIVKINEEQAKERALKHAENMGYEGLSPVWYNAYEGVAYVNLVPKIDDVVYYTDLIKVKVGLDNGKLIGLEAMGYCSCHKDRVPTFNVSRSTAISQVNKKLKIKNVQKALIPLRQSEYFCYEIYASYNGLDYFVYIDAISGKQINVMRVINNYQGQMVI